MYLCLSKRHAIQGVVEAERYSESKSGSGRARVKKSENFLNCLRKSLKKMNFFFQIIPLSVRI